MFCSVTSEYIEKDLDTTRHDINVETKDVEKQKGINDRDKKDASN